MSYPNTSNESPQKRQISAYMHLETSLDAPLKQVPVQERLDRLQNKDTKEDQYAGDDESNKPNRPTLRMTIVDAFPLASTSESTEQINLAIS